MVDFNLGKQKLSVLKRHCHGLRRGEPTNVCLNRMLNFWLMMFREGGDYPILFVFIHRSANQIAHLLSRAVCFMSGLQEWNSSAPDFITCNLMLEEF